MCSLAPGVLTEDCDVMSSDVCVGPIHPCVNKCGAFNSFYYFFNKELGPDLYGWNFNHCPICGHGTAFH